MSYAMKARQEHAIRKGKKFAALGRELEARVEKVLNTAMEKGALTFAKVERHEPLSHNAIHGKDFTVTKIINGENISRSFGIAISPNSWIMAKARYPDIQQFCFPLETKDETIISRVGQLFS